jgi:dienelactone hydrolase
VATLSGLPLVVGGRDAAASLAAALDGWTSTSVVAGGFRRLVLSKGSGRTLLLLHELPGPTVEHFATAERFVAKGFAVHCPVFFGQAGQKSRKVDTYGRFLWTKCRPGSEFSCFSATKPSRIHDWVVAYCGSIGSTTEPIAVVGMCMTGIMPLAALRARAVVAPVLCQPALPMGADLGAEVGLPPSDIELARTRMVREGITALLVRYENDTICPPSRAASLRRLFGAGIEQCELPGDGHSSLVHDHSAAAMDRVLEFVERRFESARRRR